MAALDMYNPMASRGYSMPPALGGYDLTPAQIHARETEPVEAMFTGADGRLYPAGHPMLTQQNIYNSDNTDRTGGYTPHARAALLGPTANEISANRRDSTMMNQDPARYAPDGSSLVGNPYGTDENDVVFNSLVERYMSEGLTRDQAFAKAEERMAMGTLDSLQENLSNAGTGALDFVGGLRDGGILSAGNDEDGAFARIVKQAEENRDNTPTGLTRFGKYVFPDAGGPAVPVNEQQQNPPMGMSFNPPVPALTSPSTDTGNGGTGPVLRQPTSNTASNGNAARRMTGGYTGNARGSGLPDMQIGLGERLMRMGAAGLAVGAQGPLAQMGAMTGAYNDVNQANRQAEMEAFGIEEERRQAHADRVDALAASKNKGADAETGAAATSARIALDNANAVLKGFDDFDGVTGPFNWFVSGWDSSGFGDAGRANVRLKIAKMKVDSTLARVAETKGAISEKEMEIFESDQPSFYASEDVWREWVTNYIRALKIMNTNLSTGQTPYKNGGGGGSTGSGADADTLNAARKIVGG